MGICSISSEDKNKNRKHYQPGKAFTSSNSQSVINDLLFINHDNRTKSAVSRQLEEGFRNQVKFMKMAKRDPAMHPILEDLKSSKRILRDLTPMQSVRRLNQDEEFDLEIISEPPQSRNLNK